MTKNPFDFSDLSDLPEELQKKLHTDTADNARDYAEVVNAGAAAGFAELEINQIMAAATRMGKDVPTQQTVRNYLNKACELGLISKPTRQTYGPAASAESVEEAPAPKAKAPKAKAETVVSSDPVAASDPVTDGDDPLAALGI